MPWSESTPGAAVERAAVERAASLLRAGRIVAHPTETVYGLAAWSGDPGGYEALLSLKGASTPRAFLLLFDTRERLAATLGQLPPGGDELSAAFWPGALTLLFPSPAGLPAWWTGPEGEVATRVTPHRFCRALVAALDGPVLSTSANRAGGQPLQDAASIAAAFAAEEVTLVVDGGPISGRPSTILRWTDRGWAVLRPGPVSEEALRDALADGRAVIAP